MLFRDWTVIGMVHLQALPGSALWGGSTQRVVDAAVADALALADGGVDATVSYTHLTLPTILLV